MPFKRAPRLCSFDYLGPHRYFLTICVQGRREVFVDARAVASPLAQLRHTGNTEHFAIIAYCFMLDHMHALVEGVSPHSDFKQFVRAFKQRSSFHWKQSHGVTLWQRSYFERVLRAEEDTLKVAKYILENPVRAGLVSSPEDYPLSGSFTHGRAGLLSAF